MLKDLWSGVIQELADLLNVELDDIRIWDRPEVATETFTANGGLEIAVGTVAVNHWALEGMVGGKPVIAIEHINRMRPDLAPDLPSLPGSGGYRIDIDSDELPVSLELHIGKSANSTQRDTFANAMYGTVTRALNAIDMIVDAPAGLARKEDVPPMVARNAMWL